MTKNRILVPTNFSSQADIAFKQSVYFSGKTGADIFLLHVIPSLRMIDNSSDNIDSIQNRLARMADEYPMEKGARVHSRIECGKILPQILAVEKELLPSYIFIGTDSSAKALASTTLKLIDQVSCPVVVFAGKFERTGCDNIVLPLDLTKETKQKIDQTIKIAKIYGSTVHIVSATSFTDELECDKIKSQINQVKAVFDKFEIKCVTELLKTKNDIEVMANAVNDYADDKKADLIVIMTRQETKLQKFFVGSMAIKLIRKSHVPILCVSPKQV
jgi:nucleotide-binding universal stress UspA family protein